MERNTIENRSHPANIGLQNEQLAQTVIQNALDSGVREFYICPSARCAPFVAVLATDSQIKTVYGFEERATAFFALGRSKSTQQPVAIITTSGTAVGELLPAVMEADYSAIPLLIISADRPRRYRQSGAPQTCNQVGIFSHYVCEVQDLEAGDQPALCNWDQQRPIHLNVCFDEPLLPKISEPKPFQFTSVERKKTHFDRSLLDQFLATVKKPLVLVSGINADAAKPLLNFLVDLNAPVLLEGTSNVREEPALQHLSVIRTNRILETAQKNGYEVDGILRIGGVPTIRLWRDLEEKPLPIFNLSEQRFSGLSWADVHTTSLANFFNQYEVRNKITGHEAWMQSERKYLEKLLALIQEEPLSEPALIHELSKKIPANAFVYLGNSMPIRQWDLAAARANKNHFISASRGLNGIDGQLSTFLGMCSPEKSNWALVGDLTALYDLSAPWFIQNDQTNIVIINNGGGRIFERMFPHPQFLNEHHIHFEHFAKLWNMHHQKWEKIPNDVIIFQNQIIELIPDNEATKRFWVKLSN